jgi:phytoene desaturase
MSVHTESRCEKYDAIVIGSGLGGLSTGALLAKAGKHVLVVERHDRPGGYAHNFRRGKYLFDSAVHLAGGCEPSGCPQLSVVDSTLRALGVRNRCEFLKVDPFYGAVFPEMAFAAPLGTEEFIAAHARCFPGQEDGIRKLMALCSTMNREVREMSMAAFAQAPERFANLFRYRRATLAAVLDEYVTDYRLKSLLGAIWPYAGLPPSRLSFLYWSLTLMSFIERGASYCRGTFQSLADAFVAALVERGGELLLRSRVRRIQVVNGAARGIVLENGQRIEAPIVISNADALQTFEELAGLQHLPDRYVKTLRNMKPSVTAFVLFLATSLDLKEQGAAHETFFYRSWDHDQTYSENLQGKLTGITVTIPTLIDPSVAPAGEHLLTATAFLPYDIDASWREKKTDYTGRLLDEMTVFLPWLRDHVTWAESASPRTMERYTLNSCGSMYGWEPSPQQMRRLDNETPIRGLYLAGHWTQPGGGVYAVVLSGVQTAARILGFPNAGSYIQTWDLAYV